MQRNIITVKSHKFEVERLTVLLKQSLKLQSHYAELLNMQDGGTRMQFKTIRAWEKKCLPLK